MIFKKITVLASIFIIIFPISIQAQKKRPAPYKLRALTDPNSPSYVPYPFPKSDFEILEDFKYGIKKMRIHEQPGHDIFLLEQEGITVDRIVKVKQKCLNFPHNFYYIFDITRNGEIMGRGTVDEFGLVMMGGLSTEETKEWTRPFREKVEVEDIIHMATRRKIEIKKAELVHSFSDICNILAPMWEVDTSEGTYFIDHRHKVWVVDYEAPATDETIKKRKREIILDDDKAIIKFLRKVE